MELGAPVLSPSYSRRSRKVWDRSFLSELNAATLQTRAVLRAPHWRSASVMRSASAAGGRDPVVTPTCTAKSFDWTSYVALGSRSAFLNGSARFPDSCRLVAHKCWAALGQGRPYIRDHACRVAQGQK